MNNQEAIEMIRDDMKKHHDYLSGKYRKALSMAISALQAQEETVSRKVYEQISWERDIAVMQLKDLGYGLGEKIRTDGGTISRQAAIDRIVWWFGILKQNPDILIDSIKTLPSAQPEIVRCKDCEYGKKDEVGRWFCRDLGCQIGDEDGSGYCADAERRTDGV